MQTKNLQESESYDDYNHNHARWQYHTEHDSVKRESASVGDILSYATKNEGHQSEIPEREDDFRSRILNDYEYSKRNVDFSNKNEHDSPNFYSQSHELTHLHEIQQEQDNVTSISIQNDEEPRNMFYDNECNTNSNEAIIRNLSTNIEYEDLHRRDMQSLVPKRHQRSTTRGSIEKNDEVGMESNFFY